MALSDILESQFRGDIRFRGASFLETERVAISRATADNIFGTVRDSPSSVEFQTQISRADNGVKLFCSCSTHLDKPSCRHLWATILAAEQEGIIPGALRPGFFPPFNGTEVEFQLSNDDEWDDEPDIGQLMSGLSTSKKETTVVDPPRKRTRPWETDLLKIREALLTRHETSRGPSKSREILYELDLESSRASGALMVQTSQRQRRADNTWGKEKPLKLKLSQLSDVENSLDRKILTYLLGGTPEKAGAPSNQADTQFLAFRFAISYELCDLLLPMLAESERFRLLDAPVSNPICWQPDRIWDFSIEMQTNDDGDWELLGELERDGKRMPLSQADLLIPGGLVLIGNKLSKLRDYDAFEWMEIFQQEGKFIIPSDDEKDFVNLLYEIPEVPRLHIPSELKLEEVTGTPKFILRLTTPSGRRWKNETLRGNVQFDYDDTIVEARHRNWAIVDRDAEVCLVRNREHEEKAFIQLQSAGFRRVLMGANQKSDVEIPPAHLGTAVRKLMEDNWQVLADDKKVRQSGNLTFRVDTNIDWFELHADFDFDGKLASFPELLSAIARGDNTIRLDDGSLGIIPEEWARQFGLLANLGVSEEEHMKFDKNQVGLLDALLSSQDSVSYDDQFATLKERFKSFEGVETALAPEEFIGDLRGYQREGLGWLSFLQEFNFGGCLADDMGLGKTVQLLALLSKWHKQPQKQPPSLIVVPKSLMFNWKSEALRFTPDLKVMEYAGLDREPLLEEFENFDLVLTTYGTTRRDVMKLRERQFSYIVLDEAQTIKNPGSQVAKAVRLLNAKHRIALSGTPIENHLGDLWSIFEFLNPGMLGRSSLFKAVSSGTGNEQTKMVLAKGLRPFILRRTKQEVASELPEKIEQTIYCEMDKEQNDLYDELRDHYRDSLLGMIAEQGISKSKMHVLEALLRLRQAACHPGLLNKSHRARASAKLKVLIPQLEELAAEGHKALVFSQFTSMLSIVKDHLDKQNIKYEYLDGKTRKREECVNRFQEDPDCPVFLISLKAGGLGLNLTAAEYVFLLDPWWNPAVEAQAIDRAHRVGQTKQVFAYRLICRNTVEEKISELQSKKRDLAEAILEAEGSLMSNLTTEDLEMLLS
ncbi:RNA polymerase-associated protein RapA [Polystyrenella longa]|uniref:RNA polymerase-associated protein RapA n=1 Tax=Polystyrenella longa TaxID=2528007 RepID=A0A518CM24_9PLAN|nr:DEAD/DEAH box helicase [Polystyrenella longa]QDU80275.1 RNA polymerase-associated protein RapA [Polystyrenella longa]